MYYHIWYMFFRGSPKYFCSPKGIAEPIDSDIPPSQHGHRAVRSLGQVMHQITAFLIHALTLRMNLAC